MDNEFEKELENENEAENNHPSDIEKEQMLQNYEREKLLGIPKGDVGKHKNQNNYGKKIALVLVFILIAGASGFSGAMLANGYFGVSAYTDDTPLVINITANETLDIGAAIVEKVMPSVVGVKTEALYTNIFGQTRTGQGIGTGVIVDEKGYILTNSHVVEDGQATAIIVRLLDGEEVSATLLWNEESLDLAIIKIEKPGLIASELGDSNETKVGAYAVAIGNPLGLAFERSVTQGIISGLNRSIQADNGKVMIEGLMQTDASINEGNSGGPLINSNGQVIGINTAKIQSGEGLGFAIPINVAKPIVEQFKEKGQFIRAYLGIQGIDVEQYINVYQGEDLGTNKGVYVYKVSTESPAEISDIRIGDVIKKVKDKEVTTISQLIAELYTYRPGDLVTIDLIREGRELQIEVTLGEMPSE